MHNDTAASTRRLKTAALAVAATFALAACGGGGGDPTAPPPAPPPAPETLFVPANAWTGAVPPGAQTVTPDEFRRRQVAGELVLVTGATPLAQRAAHQAHVAAERSFLESQPDLSDAVKALLAQAAAATDLEADATATLPDGRVVALNSLGTAIENAAADYRRARDPALARAAYALSYTLLDDTLKAQVPAPATLAAATLDQIRQATQQMDAALATLPDIDNTRLDPSAPPATAVTQDSRSRALAFNPGMGRDNNGPCAAPTGYARRYQFPLRNFVSPVKDQGERGLCWAFAAIAAVESRDQVQLGTTPDLSEQFLANRVKLLWQPNEYLDGGSAAFALDTAEDKFQRLPYETAWTYNPSPGRPDDAFDPGVVGTPASYYGACDGYSGSCWPVSHQSDMVCTMPQQDIFCSYEVHAFPDTAGTGVRGSRVLPVWTSGESWKLNVYRAHLAAGRSLIAVFPVYDGFSTVPATGILSNYKRQKKDKKGLLVDGSSGDHLVQIVGFVSNEQLSLPGGPPSEVGGGGYFIVRNSWGCSVADAGYYYVPADYVRDNFYSLSVLDMLPNRSARWAADQVAPGGTAGLRVNLRDNAVTTLRVPSDLAGEILVGHPVATYARLTVSSDRDGLLYDGQWLVNAPEGGSLFANALRVNFQTEGPRQVTLVARYGSQTVTTTKTVTALNSQPVLGFVPGDKPQQNENFVVNALATDLNEADPTAMCAAMTWQVTAPDTVVSGSGCSRVIRFGATGARQVSIATQDREGLTASATGSFEVLPPPANPYPRVAAFGVIARDPRLIDNTPVGCLSNAIADNAVIDLRQLGCKLNILGPDLSRFVGQVTVENPAGEALSYDWTYTDYYADGSASPRSGTARTATPSVELNRFLYVGLDGAPASAFRCTVDVRVNAPEASRSKSLRVWSGRCINVEVGPR